ncbi:MAG: heterodisulfide reductase subunit [Bacteroidales bacterium]|jgi:heterodisulfide reductase subunit A|nr:heterodisulfide reductase subunit [Bacteroidales bacterium]MDN5329985.1 heterodisulfide reductase subunit [Bacteroidales bacterium]
MVHIEKDLLIIGAGPVGLAAAATAAKIGLSVMIIEKNESAGGHLLQWRWLFPHFNEAAVVLSGLLKELPDTVQIVFGTEVSQATSKDNKWELQLKNGDILFVRAVLLCTGFQLFDAHRKEELAYGLFPEVLTSANLEEWFKDERKTADLKRLRTAAFIHCVGSRDLQCKNVYCSRICCITAVKQAIELKRLSPDIDVYLFYIDMRMSGRYYEELLLKAQADYHIKLIRGRVSEIVRINNNQLLLKAEDTLLGLPVKVTVDIAVLMAGIEPGDGTQHALQVFNMKPAEDGFVALNGHLYHQMTYIPGIFAAGACTGPVNLREALNAGRSAAVEIYQYLNNTLPFYE